MLCPLSYGRPMKSYRLTPFDVGLCVGGPFVVDLDEHGADQTDQGRFIGKHPDLLRAASQFLLYGALHGV